MNIANLYKEYLVKAVELIVLARQTKNCDVKHKAADRVYRMINDKMVDVEQLAAVLDINSKELFNQLEILGSLDYTE